MKRVKFLETIRSKSPSEITQMIKERQANLRSLRFDLSTGKVKNAGAARSLRREIARLLTELNRRPLN